MGDKDIEKTVTNRTKDDDMEKQIDRGIKPSTVKEKNDSASKSHQSIHYFFFLIDCMRSKLSIRKFNSPVCSFMGMFVYICAILNAILNYKCICNGKLESSEKNR